MVIDRLPSEPNTERRDFERARLAIARMQVSGGPALKETLGKITETAAETLQVERVGIWLYIHDRRAIRCFDVFQRTRREHSEGAILNAADFPEYFQTLEKQRSIAAIEAVTDPVTERLKDAYLDPLGITSMLDAPIFRAGQVIGVVCHEHVGLPRRWTREETDFAGSVADSISLKLESAARADAELSRNALEAHLAELHKMDAMGRFAATIAHDFKNILTVVHVCASLLASENKKNAQIVELSQQILDAADRGNTLTNELMSFGRTHAQKTCILDVSETVGKIIPMLQTTVGSEIKLTFEKGPNPGLVLVDRAHIERIVLNLVLNSRDAMPKGGTISLAVIETRVTDDIGDPGVYIAIEVTDNGTGMDAATRARLFEPFFTTKIKGKGTGLGLAIVHRIVDRAGGFLHVASEPGQGTTVRVYLPRVAS